MKNAKKLTLKQKMFLEAKGFDPKFHKVIKNTSECFVFLNTETGVQFTIWR